MPRVSPGFETRECKTDHRASVPLITASRNHYFYTAGMPSGLERWHGGDDLHFITFSCYRRQLLLGSAERRDLFLQVLEQVTGGPGLPTKFRFPFFRIIN